MAPASVGVVTVSIHLFAWRGRSYVDVAQLNVGAGDAAAAIQLNGVAVARRPVKSGERDVAYLNCLSLRSNTKQDRDLELFVHTFASDDSYETRLQIMNCP